MLMCNNAMTYNAPETVYYTAAKNLLTAGLKIIAKVCSKQHTHTKYTCMSQKVSVHLIIYQLCNGWDAALRFMCLEVAS